MIVYKGRLLKKSSNRKLKLVLSRLFTTSLSNIAIHLRPIWLQILVAKLAIDSESCQTLFQAFACHHLKSLCCSVRIWADTLSSDRSSTWICCFAQEVIWNGRICSNVIFLLRDQWIIERLSETMSAALVGNNFSPITSKISSHTKKRPDICKASKTFWLLNWFSIATVVAPQASRRRPAATAAAVPPTQKRRVFVLASPTRPRCAWARPQELGHGFCSQNLRLSFGTAFESDCQITGRS